MIFSPQEAIQHNNLCPECGKKLTIGVMHRVNELADRDRELATQDRIPYKNLIPLNEVIAEAVGKTASSKSVWDIYFRFIHEFGSEYSILTKLPIEELKRVSPERVALGVENMRKGAVKIIPGHDGCFGKISLFEQDDAQEQDEEQLSLFK